MSHILLVEDDIDVREAIAEVLIDAGYEVSLAANGREALDHLHAALTLPDLVLLDLMMPVMDGWAFCAELERTPGAAGVPVVVLSAAGVPEERVAALHAAGYLRKPIDLRRLRETVARHGGPRAAR